MKTVIRRLLGFIFFYSGLVDLVLARQKKNYAMILFGHKVTKDQIGFFSGVHPGDFDRVIGYLSKKFNWLTMDQLIERLQQGEPFDDRYLVLTLDDGFRDNYLNAFPAIQKHQATATIYLVSGCIDSGYLPWAQRLGFVFQQTRKDSINWTFDNLHMADSLLGEEAKRSAFLKVKKWLSTYPALEREAAIVDLERVCGVRPLTDQMLNWQQILDMKNAGICFGAHTHTHPILKNLALPEALEEISRSKKLIETNLKTETKNFAFPAGSYSEELLRKIPGLGFQSCFTRGQDFRFKIYPGADAYSLPRLGISNEPYYVIISEVAGLFNFLRRLL